MKTQITRVPLGLQNFLGSQAQGRNPSELNQEVQPTLDMTQWYVNETDRWYVEAGALPFDQTPPQGQDAVVTVPEGELWLVKRLSAGVRLSGLLQAPQPYEVTLQFFIQFPLQSNSPGTQLGVSGFRPFVPSQGGQSGDCWQIEHHNPPLVCFAGTEIQLWHCNVNGATEQDYLDIMAINYDLIKI